MNTQPTNEYLNRERLTDLAQFAVPGGHDLWPRIEKAARASASGITTPRPGILSLGLSRAWTAVGIFFIAATFAALGFGLAVLVLSNDSDQVPAAQPEATVTPTPITSTASAIRAGTGGAQSNQGKAVGTGTSDGLEALLTGDTLARYRTLPEEYRAALGAYRAFGLSDDLVPTVVAEKMDQWPDNPEPISELLDPDRYAKFQELTAIHPQLGDTIRMNRYAFFFLSYYPYVVQTEDTAEGRQEAFALLLDAIADEFSPGNIPEVPDPELADVIIPTAVDALDELGPRLHEAIRTRRTGDTVDVQSLAIELLTFEFLLLKTEPGLETPTLSQYLSEADKEAFEALSPDVREAAEGRYVRSVLFRITSFALSPDHSTTALPDEDTLTEIAKQEFQFTRQLTGQQTIPSREAAHAKMQTILTGETLDRYRALPPAYQEALGLYTWHSLSPDIVRSAVKDKIDQWGDWVFPLPEFVGKERAERFDGLEGEIVNHAYLLVSYYVLVLNTEPPDLSRSVAMRQFMDYVAPPDTEMPSPSEPDKDASGSSEAPMVEWPPLEKVLTNTALARVDLLGPRLRERVTDSISSSEEDDIKNVATFLTLYELFLLKAQPGLEMSSLEDALTGEDLATFKNFSEADRDSADGFFQRGLFSLHYVGAAGHPPNSTIPDPTPEFLADQAAFAMEWVSLPEKSESDQDATPNTPRIAFHSNRDGNWNIYVMNSDGSDQTRLTDNPAADSWPSWSPDGRRIAFISPRDDPDPDDDDPIWEIYVMNADGSAQTRLTNDSAWHSLPRWSPDGRHIAFQSRTDGNWEILVINADGSGQASLTDAGNAEPSWSPDGRHIAFTSDRDGNTEIYIMNADGSGRTRLTDNATSDRFPIWSPDGQRIAFYSYRDENWEIYVMNADGSGQTRLTNNPARDIRPSWSPDGRHITFSTDRDDPDPDDDERTMSIYLMNADGSNQTRLTDNSASDHASDWSPK